jgi:hypothetical protein
MQVLIWFPEETLTFLEDNYSSDIPAKLSSSFGEKIETLFSVK